MSSTFKGLESSSLGTSNLVGVVKAESVLLTMLLVDSSFSKAFFLVAGR